ncbi:MAG TPA: pyridoxal phosphate-dependent aminotransferase [candidate division Zixibacteria bacterium]|nr:pyridoxal phosphate-dependent aminotransferase [candidate division Zixibacteria bacterium]
MWQLSRRANEIQASPIRKLVPYADEARKKGIHVYHLNIGQPDIETPPEFWDAIKTYQQKVLAYGHSQGLASYLKALSGYYHQCGLEISPDEIVVTTGGSEAIVFAFTLICEPGEKIIVFEPFYTNYNGFATMASIELLPLETKAEKGFHLPSREVIEAAIDDDVRGIMICNPNNPTGTLFSYQEMEMLADIARENGLFILSDEVYREFVYEGVHTSIFDIPNVDEFAIMLDSISKRYSACGARVGCLVTKNHKLHQAAVKFGQARLCPPTLEQVGAEAALKLGAPYFEKVMGEYRKRRDIVYEGLMAIKGTVCVKPAGAFYAMAKLPISDSEEFAKFMLSKFSYQNKTVMVAPGPGFYASPNKGSDECRIAYVLNTESLKDAMQILKLGVEAFNSR